MKKRRRKERHYSESLCWASRGPVFFVEPGALVPGTNEEDCAWHQNPKLCQEQITLIVPGTTNETPFKKPLPSQKVVSLNASASQNLQTGTYPACAATRYTQTAQHFSNEHNFSRPPRDRTHPDQDTCDLPPYTLQR
jgi:hypothetical protein